MPPRGRGSRGRGKGGHEDPVEDHGLPSSSSSEHTTRVAMFCFCVAAIYAAYISQGVLQENISTKKYGKDQRRFEHLTFLNLTQCLVCFLWSFLMLKIWPGEPGTDAPIMAYRACSVSNTIGPACGIVALKYISYPAQVLAKSSKMIPVMLMGAVVYGVKYSIQEYLCTFLVAGGVSVFALFKAAMRIYPGVERTSSTKWKRTRGLSNTKASKVASPNALLGYSLCLMNLALDGFTNATQDALTAKYPKVNAWHLMMGMNLWGTIYMAVFMFLVPGGGGYTAIAFCMEQPEVAWDIFLFCICGAVGQNFIFLTISRFGALTNTTITTTRKFVSILVSSIWNQNPLSLQQWGGVCMVFTGLSYQIWVKYQRKQQKSQEAAVALVEHIVSRGRRKRHY